jgi:hypothetical protein
LFGFSLLSFIFFDMWLLFQFCPFHLLEKVASDIHCVILLSQRVWNCGCELARCPSTPTTILHLWIWRCTKSKWIAGLNH